MRTTICSARRLAGLCLPPVMALCACTPEGGGFSAGGHDYRHDRFRQWALPSDLREISGLALDPHGRLFAHCDERASIYQLDYEQGGVIKRFHFGDPAAHGDFEGIAWVQDRIFLVTSDGHLLSAAEGADGEHVDFERFDTGLGRRCEIEGLHYEPEADILLLPCKTVLERRAHGRLVVFAWSPGLKRRLPQLDIEVDLPPGIRLHASGVTRSPDTGALLIIAARQRSLIELDPAGGLRQVMKLPDPARHPQMEGIEMTRRGDLVIADEGGGGRGRLGVYRVVH